MKRNGTKVRIINRGSTFYDKVGTITSRSRYGWYRVFFEDFSFENPLGVIFLDTEVETFKKSKDSEAIDKIVKIVYSEFMGDIDNRVALDKIDRIIRTVRNVAEDVQASKVGSS